jgi:hypothetical protein
LLSIFFLHEGKMGGKEEYGLVPGCTGLCCSGNTSGELWDRHEITVPCIIVVVVPHTLADPNQEGPYHRERDTPGS